MNTAIWGLLGALIGASASIVTTILANNNSNKFQIKLNTLKRESLAREFQRQNLLLIQEKFYHLFRLVGKVHVHDMNYFKEHGKWQFSKLDSSLDMDLGDSLRELSYLIERVANDDLRVSLKELKINQSKVTLAKSQKEQMALIELTIKLFDSVMAQIGEELRANF